MKIADRTLQNNLTIKGDITGVGDDWFLRSVYNPGFSDEIEVGRNFNQAANQLGLITLGTYHDRVGANTRTMYHKDDQPHTPWVKVLGEKGDVNNAKSTEQQRASGANYDYKVTGIQIGLDIDEKLDDNEVLTVSGLYFTHANMKNDLYSFAGEHIGKSSLDSNSLSFYYTRTNKEDDYFDFVAQYTRYGDVKGNSIANGHQFGSKGWSALISGELGYPNYLDEKKEWNLEPQLQLIYQHTALDEVFDRDYIYTPKATNTLTGRLGVRLAYHNEDEKDQPWDAFIRANYWHTFGSSAQTNVRTTDGIFNQTVETNLAPRKLQLGLGMTYQPDVNWQIFFGADYNKHLGKTDGDSFSGHVGLKLAF